MKNFILLALEALNTKAVLISNQTGDIATITARFNHRPFISYIFEIKDIDTIEIKKDATLYVIANETKHLDLRKDFI